MSGPSASFFPAASDGTLGLEAIKAEAGITLARDESAKYDSMPRNAIAAGCVDFVLLPERIAVELGRIAKRPYVTGVGASGRGALEREMHERSAPSGAPAPQQ